MNIAGNVAINLCTEWACVNLRFKDTELAPYMTVSRKKKVTSVGDCMMSHGLECAFGQLGHLSWL